MKTHLFSKAIILFLIAIPFFVACKAKHKDEDKDSPRRTANGRNSADINDIAKEYKRIAKLCNEIEIELNDADNAEPPGIDEQLEPESKGTDESDEPSGFGSRKEIRKALKELKKDVMNLQTEVNASMLDDKSFDQKLAKSGFNYLVIDELSRRIEKLQRAAR